MHRPLYTGHRKVNLQPSLLGLAMLALALKINRKPQLLIDNLVIWLILRAHLHIFVVITVEKCYFLGYFVIGGHILIIRLERNSNRLSDCRIFPGHWDGWPGDHFCLVQYISIAVFITIKLLFMIIIIITLQHIDLRLWPSKPQPDIVFDIKGFSAIIFFAMVHLSLALQSRD